MNKFTLNKVLSILSKCLIVKPDTYAVDIYRCEVFYNGLAESQDGICTDRDWSVELRGMRYYHRHILYTQANVQISEEMEAIGVHFELLNDGAYTVIRLD